MATKKAKKPKIIDNRRARFDYELGDELNTGIVLTGPEVKAIRLGHAQLRGAFVTLKSGELWLNNASLTVSRTHLKDNEPTIDTSARKLLAKKSEINKLESAKQKGMTIVPVRILPAGRFIKVVIALAKGKKNYDKRETIKRRDQERDANRDIKRAS